ALAGFHFDKPPLDESNASHELDGIVPHAEISCGDLAHDGERAGDEVPAESVMKKRAAQGLRRLAQTAVIETGNLSTERLDFGRARSQRLDASFEADGKPGVCSDHATVERAGLRIAALGIGAGRPTVSQSLAA